MTADDQVLDYVLAARPLHQALREALIQVSAFALIMATQPVRTSLDMSPLDRARAELSGPAEELAALHVPAGAAHHHHHLLRTAAVLKRAIAAGYAAGDEAERLYAAVEAAERELRAAGRALPGFEIVDFGQACCAFHAAAQPAITA